MQDFARLLLGKDLRTIKKSNKVVQLVEDQATFDTLFALLLHHERTLVMRAADAVEKITIRHKEFLQPHKHQILSLLKSPIPIEFKWHVAQLIPRLQWDPEELQDVWTTLAYWAQNPNESKIVRVSALQALFELSQLNPSFKQRFINVFQILEHETIPSLKARIRKLRKAMSHD